MQNKPKTKFYIIILISIILSLIAVIFAATFNKSTLISFPGRFDSRLSGVNVQGWTELEFSLNEPILISNFYKIGIAFEQNRPKESGNTKLEIFAENKKTTEQIVKKAPLYLEENSNNLLFKILNPVNENNSLRSGLKLTRLKIIPTNFLLFPNILKFKVTFFSVILFVLSFYLFTSKIFEKSKFITNILGLVLPALISGYLLSKSEYYGWYRAYWFFIPISIFILSISFSNVFNIASNSIKNTSRYSILILLFVLIGGYIRLSGVSFGLPDFYHPDEARKLVIARGMIEYNNLDPNYFRHPTFLLYSTAALGKVKTFFTGETPSLSELAVLGRSVSAVLGTASIYLIYLITSAIVSNFAGVIAAAIITFAPMHIVCSRYIKEDVGMIFFMLLSLLNIVYFFKKNLNYKYILLAGLFAGFASSVKYTGALTAAFCFAPIITFLLYKFFSYFKIQYLSNDLNKIYNNKEIFKPLLIYTFFSLVLVIVGFLLITPYSIFNHTKFLEDFGREGAHMSKGHSGVISAAQYLWSFHIEYSYLKTLGIIIFIGSIVGAGVMAANYTVFGLIPILGFLLFYLPAEWVNAKPFPQPERYILPTIFFLAISYSYLISNLAIKFSSKQKYLYIIVILSLTPLITNTYYQFTNIYNDTREESKIWANQNIPKGSKILSDWFFYGPNLSKDEYQVSELKDPEEYDTLRTINVENLKEYDADYFITSSFFYNRYLYQLPAGDPTGRGFKEIFEKLTPIIEFNRPNAEFGFHNPTIKIYKLR
jgi:hypothetical protein